MASERGPAPVSVVVPCYRCTATIERAVKSVAAQTARPAELILVEDASPDGTAAHLEALRRKYGADWIQVIRLPVNGGPASARNAGWEAARQKYIAFLDADDAWHPRKVEIQLAWMEAHPDVAVTGHGAVQLGAADDSPADPGAGEAKPVGKAALYAANRFVTPSVMLRRDIPQRFEAGARHMEDYLLWLEIAEAGHRIAKLPQVLAYTFKAPYGEAGLSAQLWSMEKGELHVFSQLRRKGRIGAPTWLALSAYSLVKFVRRMLMMSAGYSPGGNPSRPALAFAGSYLVLTQAMTALLVCAGLVGRAELAADIAVVQAATLATFFSFSGNARNLILTLRTPVPREALLAARLVLLVPLGAAAALLCIVVARVEPALALVLIARRGVEWIGELHLSECELLGRRAPAAFSFFLQSALLLAALLATALWPAQLPWFLAAWALVPALPLLAFMATGFAGLRRLPQAAGFLLPHFGSTAVSGIGLYAFRTLLVLLAGKALAGILFVAFALGSFPGSLFANVLGPSVSLHEERVGRAYVPRVVWLVMVGYLALGGGLLAAAWLLPGVLAWSGKPLVFWVAVGLSLVGGAVMLVAQRVRLRLLSGVSADALFGADVLMYVCLIASIPALYATGRGEALAALYAMNAALALLFYATATEGLLARLGARRHSIAVGALVFLLFLPLFFFVDGRLFHSPLPIWDSGGVLANVPLPVSLGVGTAGLVLLGGYERARPALWTILGLLCLMLLSTELMHGESAPLEKAKMLLMLQVVLPTFGLVLGAAACGAGARDAAAKAILAVVALVVPVQLAFTLANGTFTLGHSMGVFSIYQHLQFVPVILVCGYLAVLPGFWSAAGPRGRLGLGLLAACVAAYAMAALSTISIAAAGAGVVLFAAWRWATRREGAAVLLAAAAVAALAGYGALARDTDAFRNKFDFLFPAGDPWVFVSGHTEGARRRLDGSWRIVGLTDDGNLLRIPLRGATPTPTLVVEGRLDSGALAFVAERNDEVRTVLETRQIVARPGPFRVEVTLDRGRGDDHVQINQAGARPQATIARMTWQWASRETQPGRDGTPAAGSKEAAVPVRNVAERFSDWRLFGLGVFESAQSFLFGHATPLPREQRTSAHNFYIDFAYNFGTLALLPLLLLMAYTARLAWRARPFGDEADRLVPLLLVVALLLLAESSLKVSLRQPYPGIAIYFLWGMLLALLRDRVRLRAPREAAA